ncbi:MULTISPECIES: DUF2164 domain-containing protein [Microvirgula]|uniref:DUF2164 domain-containing protein n=1 Tax=Microvirgula aerodenitrificans TaxID=57480 RepID=A0A2S0PE88_9NEIS|nr:MULTISPECIES: DUF2164 domain-containing protein [Microvirgula]AVY95577.1 DUF2164 domain-containing protein [Microvirgula aerodenitrificans]RAS13757.1 uncharacterized protein (DUF2164 family) [Microvirgula sp. AG722]
MASPSLLNQQQIQALAVDVQRYLRDSLEVELGQFDVQFLLDFIIDKAGREIYNQALNDAQTALAGRLESLQAAIWDLEK